MNKTNQQTDHQIQVSPILKIMPILSHPCYYKGVPQHPQPGTVWELLRNAECQGFTRAYGIRICILTNSPGEALAVTDVSQP